MRDLSCVDLSKTYLQMKPSGDSKAWEATEFWNAVKTGKGIDSPFGFMVAQYSWSSSWNHWECHPNGDELLIAVDGCLQLLLEIDGKESTVTLEAPSSFLVPRGIWHTANLTKPCRIIGVSAGEGTQGRPR